MLVYLYYQLMDKVLHVPRGDMEGERVARGERAGEKEGDMAAWDSNSCEIGDLHNTGYYIQ